MSPCVQIFSFIHFFHTRSVRSLQHTTLRGFKAHTAAVYGRSLIDLTVAKALPPFIMF